MTRARTLAVIGATSLVAAFTVAGCSTSGSIEGSKAGQSRTPHPAASSSATPTQMAPSSSATPSPTPPPPSVLRPGVSDQDLVQALVIPPEKLNPDWSMKLTDGGDGLSVNTLDLCGAPYPSDALRTARRQVQYGPDTDDMGVSNEIVTYRPGGAAQALKEVQQAVATCPGGKVQEKDMHGGMAIYHVQKLLITGPKWLPGTQAYYVEIDHLDGSTTTECEIFQSRANVVDIVYGAMDGQQVSSETLTLANEAAAALSVTSQNV
jgi:hypothetical protein